MSGMSNILDRLGWAKSEGDTIKVTTAVGPSCGSTVIGYQWAECSRVRNHPDQHSCLLAIPTQAGDSATSIEWAGQANASDLVAAEGEHWEHRLRP